MAMMPKRWPNVSAVRMPHSAIPSTGLRVASRAVWRPGSLKQATTKAAASLSRARMARQSGAMTPSASLWLSMPGGPSAKVRHSIAGPPGRRSGASPSSIAAVTATVELGLMTTMLPAMRSADPFEHGIDEADATLLEIGQRVLRHCSEIGTENEMDAEARRRRRVGFRLGALGEGLGEGDCRLVLPDENAKSGRLELGARRLGWEEEAYARLARPRHRIVRRAAGPRGDIPPGEAAPPL